MLKITLIACGNKMPKWVEVAVAEYSKRLREYVQLSIIEIPLLKRSKNQDIARILEKESARMFEAIPASARVIALEIEGKAFSSEKLAHTFEQLSQTLSHICFIIGGPEGLSETILASCHESWSLSKLTLAHPLVRIVFLEAVYRAYAILNNHPYHK